MKKKITLLILVMLISVVTFSQVVISSSGDFYSNANGSISYTIGESFTKTVSSSNNILTQGFQQSAWWFVNVEKKDNNTLNLIIYPNPTNGDINIRFPKTNSNQYLIKLINIEGKIVYSKQITLSRNTHYFNIHYLPSNIYYLQVISGNKLIEQIAVSKLK